MADPPQWPLPNQANAQAPLDPSGSDFPCQDGIPDEQAKRKYEPGSSVLLQLQGSAVHGGGSGQMLITYDLRPTKATEWHVMTSWEGDHPIKAPGNLPANPNNMLPPLHFTVPKTLKSGKAVMAWSWFNRIGNREHYIKCATVEIGGSVSDLSGYESLPTMMMANDGSGCTVPEMVDAIAFNNPGPEIIKAPGYTQTPISCDNSKPGAGGSGSDASSSGESQGSPSGAPDSSVAATSSVAPSSSVESVAPSSSVAPVEPTLALSASAPPSGLTLSQTNTYTSSEPASASAPPTGSLSALPSSGIVTSPGSNCTLGEITCPTPDTWAQCASGAVVPMGPVPSGYQCKNGNLTLS